MYISRVTLRGAIRRDMPAPAGSVRVVIHGTAPGNEIWETGFWMTGTGVDNQDDANSLAEIIWAELSATDNSGAMTITMAQMASQLQTWTSVRVYAYPAGGTIAQFIGEHVLASPMSGSRTLHLPNQCSQVLTLLTGAAGRSARGRMYLPNQGLSLGGDGQADVGTVTAVANGWATAFTDINASDTGKIVVVSQKLVAARQVTSVRMDTKVDIQRRRANKQLATAQHASAVTP